MESEKFSTAAIYHLARGVLTSPVTWLFGGGFLCLAVLIPVIMIAAVFTFKSEPEDLTDVYAYITELDMEFLQTVRGLPDDSSYSEIETWTYVVNGVETMPEAIYVATDADYLLKYLDVTRGDFKFAAVKTQVQTLHAALNQFHLDFDPDPDVHRAWVQITLVSPRAYFLADPTAYPPATIDHLDAMMALGPYIATQFLANPFADLGIQWTVSSRFGYRLHPITGLPDHHLGLDLPMPEGTLVQAVWGGEVEVPAYDDSGYGHWVRVTAGERKIIYAHLSTINVSSGQVVAIGEPIGTVGHTGDATGDHLHLEYHWKNKALNPAFYLLGGV
jgi:murein DD-endopeptidase MepM/ murein hydrolase activator NlpD